MSNIDKLTTALDLALPANTSTRGSDPEMSSEFLMYETRMAILSCPLVLDYMSYLLYRESLNALSELKRECMEFCRVFVLYKRGGEEPVDQLKTVSISLDNYLSKVTEFYSIQGTKHNWVDSIKSDLLDERNSVADPEESLARRLVSESIPTTLTGGYLILPENIDFISNPELKLAYKGEPFPPDNYICTGCKTRFGLIISIDGNIIDSSLSATVETSKTVRFPFFSSEVSTYSLLYSEDFNSLVKNMYLSGILDKEDYYVKVSLRGLKLLSLSTKSMPEEVSIDYPFYIKKQFSYIKRLFSRHSSPVDLFTFLSKAGNLSSANNISTQKGLNSSISAISEFADTRSSI